MRSFQRSLGGLSIQVLDLQTAYPTMTSAHDDPLLREEVQSRYVDWKQRFDGRTMPELQKKHIYSTSWEKLWGDAWAEYDQLETIRLERGFTRLTWQDTVDEDRRVSEGMRKYKSKSASLTAYDWSQVPLGLILEKYLGTSIRGGDSDAAVALGRWRRFREVVAEQAHFRHSLSVPQNVSWTILTHWWLGTYQDPTLSNAAIASLEAAASSQDPMVSFFGEAYPDAETFAQLRKSVYHAIMFDLFNREFNPHHWEPHVKEILLTTLQFIRSKAIQRAIAQRLGYSSYMNIKGLRTHDAGLYMGSIDKPCPWLRREGDHKEMPFFLWDVEQRRTVIVNQLETEPEYCCVSHTWGRWRKEAIPIDGVPWLVPQNEKFEVGRLPEHLQQIRPRIRFIWIDLFCIPQDGSIKADEEINRQASIFQNASRCIAWINDARQWDGTTKALDWLGVSYLHATTCPGIYDTDTLLNSLRHQADTSSELFSLQNDPAEVKTRHSAGLLAASGPLSVLSNKIETLVEPACWFSSLWTLQEAMLCPDITFVAQDWMPLNDKAGTSLPVDAFFSFIDTVESVWRNGMPYKVFTEGTMSRYSKYNILLESDEHFQSDGHQYLKWPNGPRQLQDLCLVTRMNNLVESPSPVGLLMVANVRQCTGSRAPAIMSALGITDWYKPKTKSDTDLVLNTYPLAFVKEAASKLGASFYESVTRRQKIPKRYVIFNRSHKGSMMPFSATNGWYSHILGMPIQHRYTPEDHPAVKTWTIKQDASVDIKRAGIVASTEFSSPNDSPMLIDIMKRGSIAQNCPFSEWAKDLPEGVCAYAVSLLRDSQRQYGLILQGYRRMWFSTQRLVKIGTFILPGTDLPLTTGVDWVVW